MASPSSCTANRPALKTTTSPSVATTGEVFADGTIIDLVRSDTAGLSLVVSTNGQKPKNLPQVEHRGRLYVPATLDASCLKLMQLPARASSPGHAAKLFNNMKEFIHQLTGIELQFAQLAACFAIATWFTDLFAEGPVLIVTGPRLLACAVLRALSYFCRRSVLLRLLRFGDLGSVPLHFSPTLLLDVSTLSRTAIRRLLVPSAANFGIPNRGQLVQFSGAKAVYTGMVAPPLQEGGVRLPLTPTANPSFPSTTNAVEIATEFQERLLGYRLANYFEVQNTSFDVPAFSFAARTLARNLGACIVGDAGLRDGVVTLFGDYSGAEREEQASDSHALVIEALLVCCHQQKCKVYVADVAQIVNTIAQGRAEILNFSAREVGERLRNLGVAASKRDQAGWAIILDSATCDRVHRLASDYDVRMLEEAAGRFHCCAAVRKKPPKPDIKAKGA